MLTAGRRRSTLTESSATTSWKTAKEALCFDALISVHNQALFGQCGIQALCHVEYCQVLIVWIALVLPQNAYHRDCVMSQCVMSHCLLQQLTS